MPTPIKILRNDERQRRQRKQPTSLISALIGSEPTRPTDSNHHCDDADANKEVLVGMGDSDRHLLSDSNLDEGNKLDEQPEEEESVFVRSLNRNSPAPAPEEEDDDINNSKSDGSAVAAVTTPGSPTPSYYHLYTKEAMSPDRNSQNSRAPEEAEVTTASTSTEGRTAPTAAGHKDAPNAKAKEDRSGSNAEEAHAGSEASRPPQGGGHDEGVVVGATTQPIKSALTPVRSPPPRPVTAAPPDREVSSSRTLSSNLSLASEGGGGSAALSPTPQAPKPPESKPPVMSQDQVRTSEAKKSKIVIRVLLGACMFGFFSAFVYMGHLYVSGLVAVVELLLFRELVRVRYNAHFDKIQNKIPFFRTTQWCWFVLSIVYTYGDFVYDVIQSNPGMHHLNRYLQYLSPISFVLYSGVFVLTISTLQPGYIKFQMNQLCWTTLVILLTVGQLKYVFHNIYNGLIWFVLPCCLVFTNDIAAYVTGTTWGRKFIQRKFLALSPNKTWEGFIGGWACTMITAWYLAKVLAQYPWMICPTNRFTTAIHAPLVCTPDPIFLEAQSYVPSQIFELLPDVVVKLIPGVVDICLVKSGGGGVGGDLLHQAAAVAAASATGSSGDAPFASSAASTLASAASSAAAGLGLLSGERLTPCVSGDLHQVHHHFELTMRNHYPIQVHALWLGLFASLVAPFGGFLASAMKRAYGIKDFDSLIPGHGGVMDRMDCQFLMALCTWVHYNTFVKLATVSVPRLTYLYGLLTDQEKVEFLKSIASAKAKIKFDDFLARP